MAKTPKTTDEDVVIDIDEPEKTPDEPEIQLSEADTGLPPVGDPPPAPVSAEEGMEALRAKLRETVNAGAEAI